MGQGEGREGGRWAGVLEERVKSKTLNPSRHKLNTIP